MSRRRAPLSTYASIARYVGLCVALVIALLVPKAALAQPLPWIAAPTDEIAARSGAHSDACNVAGNQTPSPNADAPRPERRSASGHVEAVRGIHRRVQIRSASEREIFEQGYARVQSMSAARARAHLMVFLN